MGFSAKSRPKGDEGAALCIPNRASQAAGAYFHSESIPGSKHFAIWPLEQAAQACFGSSDWPSDRVTPQASVEFEVDSAEAVAEAAKELELLGHALLHQARLEPWGQTVARLLSPEHLIVGISFAPSLHNSESA